MELAEHPGAAEPRNFDRFFLQDLPYERRHPRVLGMKPVRPDIEMKRPVVPGTSKAADKRIPLDDGDGAPLCNELVGNRQTRNPGTHDDGVRPRCQFRHGSGKPI